MSRLLLVGWDAADWKIIRPLVARGEMPHLARLISEGAHGNIATIHPPLSPMLWTSIATGKRPYKHGIHGFIEPAEDGLSIRPITSLGRKTKAFWNILNQNGKRCIVVGWWPSHPAEPIRGAMVSDRFAPATSDHPSKPMLPAAVWPPDLRRDLSELRVHAVELTGEILRMFVPDFDQVDQEKDKSLHDLAGIVSETMSVHAAATELLERVDWDVAAVYYVGIDHFSHRFMRYHAGRIRREEATPPQVFSKVLENAYRYHDLMLGRLLALAGQDSSVMVMSDHGFHSDRLLPDYIPAEAAGPAAEHRHFGMFCLRAPGVPAGREVYGATVLDIAPTVLHLCGLPAGADMDGKVLINCFEDQTILPRIPSWDDVAGEDGRHPSWMPYDGESAAGALQQLIDLGYIAAPGDDTRKAVAETIAENRYNLARAYMDGGLPDQAAGILEDLIARDREQGRYHLHLFECRFMQADFEGCTNVLNAFDEAAADFAPRAAEELERRRTQRPDREVPLDVRGRPDQAEMTARGKLQEKAGEFQFERLIARSRVMLAQAESPENRAAAHELLEQLEPLARGRPEILLFLATGFATLRDFPRALEYTRRARRADRDYYHAMALEARIHQAAGRHRECVEAAVDSLALVYFQPTLHYHMGLSLRHLGEEAQAEQAFRTALAQMPGLIDAHVELAKIMQQHGQIGDASLHRARARLLQEEAERRRNRPPDPQPETPAPADPGVGFQPLDRWSGAPPKDRSQVVTIVTGLPRSGTSMMMQLLAAAGIEPFSDAQRLPDEDNPRGYFEHERATRLHEDSSWLPQARGKVVKIVAHLLTRLPRTEHYRIVFLHRNLDEVIASQRAMLDRLGRSGESLTDAELARVYTGQLVRIQEWLRRVPGVQVMSVDYAAVLADPAATVARLAEFLGDPFHQARAAAAVDPALQRQGKPAAGA